MYKHPIPEFIPEIRTWTAGKTKLTVKHPSDTAVPPAEGLEYAKAPFRGEHLLEMLRDRFFFAQLYGIYGISEFPRGNLDAGRLNRLWCDGILEVVDAAEGPTDPEASFRLNPERAMEVYERRGRGE